MYTPVNALAHLSPRDSRPMPGDSSFRDDYNETRSTVQTGARVIGIGAIVGIVIGALVLIGSLVAVCMLVHRRNKRRADNAAATNKGVFGPGGRHSDASSTMPPGYGWGAGVDAPRPAAGHHGQHGTRKDFAPGHAGAPSTVGVATPSGSKPNGSDFPDPYADRDGRHGRHVAERKPIGTSNENLEHDISCDAEGDVDSSSAKSRHPQKGDSAVPAARRPLDSRDIYRRLLELEPLRHLWPQVVRKCMSTDLTQASIEKFVRQFSYDLRSQFDGEGEDDLSARTKNILAESVYVIEHTILEAHRNPCENESLLEWCGRLEDMMGRKGSNQDGIKEPAFTNEDVDKILFESTAMQALQAGMVDFISSAPQEPAPMLVLRGLRMWLENTMEYLIRVPPSAAVTRVSWRCKCGRNIVDDYLTPTPQSLSGTESVHRLHAISDYGDFTRYVKAGLPHEERVCYKSKVTASPSPQTASWTVSGLYRGLSNLATSVAKGTARLPRHNQAGATSDHGRLGMCPPTLPGIQQGPVQHNFVLLCVPFMRHGAKLFQPETCTINSDREFFQAVRYHYRQGRGSTAWSRLRKVRSLKFVKFEVYQSELVDIQQCPSMPPNLLDYLYEPAESNPPVGPNLLMHLFEHPDHAEVLPVLFRRIPKKLSRLQACQRTGSSVGWGIQIHEGLDWVALFYCGCVGFAACLITAVAWTVVRDDVQGGFAIASFMLAFLALCGGMVHSEVA
ncbi:hypothetical protein PoMZ_00055 [Pyricularia oryzae]|uniref:Uncharacterized protein n=1 Tax=Pyricularia oryzae TaxID=318829 RepID=A0A4P7N1A5_PYROR|nr:hypothetical protein PoMZ_00055 [Pyricularia oryzae]